MSSEYDSARATLLKKCFFFFFKVKVTYSYLILKSVSDFRAHLKLIFEVILYTYSQNLPKKIQYIS